MWPQILDLDRETCLGILRRLELEAYSSVAKALRAQGDLNKERRKILNDLGNVLSIPMERHKAEMRRVANDELLSTIALKTSSSSADLCSSSSSEWAQEGRRIIPLLRRALPLTALTPKADQAKAAAKASHLLPPEQTRSKTPVSPLKKSKHPPPPSLESFFENGAPQISLPERRPALPEDIVLLPSGMAVRFRKEGKGGPFKTEMIMRPPAPEPKKSTTKKPAVKRRAPSSESSIPSSKKSKPVTNTTSVSQAGHGYARPFGVIPSSPAKKTPLSSSATTITTSSITSTSITAPVTTTAMKPPPPKVVLVADPSKTHGTSSSEASAPTSNTTTLSMKTPPLPKLPNNMSKETVAKLIQTASPGGARILPKPPGSQQPPIYVLAAAPAGTNVASSLPSARILNATSNSSNTNNTRSLPRVVQVSGSPVVRAGGGTLATPPGAAPAIPSSVLGGIQSTTTTIRTIQSSSGPMRTFSTPRVPHSAAIRHNAGKPSVIVVQRKTPPTSSAQNSTLKTTTLTTKDLINKQAKIYQTPKGGAKPVVIVSKPQSLSSSSISATSTMTTTSNQNNVIVLDLSREQLKNNSILTDLLHASGILGEDGENKDVVVNNSNNKTTTTIVTNTIETISSCPEVVVQKSCESGILSMDSSKIMLDNSDNPVVSGELDNGVQKENIKIVSTTAPNKNANLTQDVNDAIITIPEASKSVSLDKVPVEIEGVIHAPASPVETMEDITSFIEETNPNNHSDKETTT